MIARNIYDQACDWIVRLDSDTASAAERSDFVRWLNRSPDHAAAYQEMSRLWARLDTLSLSKPQSFHGRDAGRKEAERQSPWFLGYRGAMAASLAVIVLIIGTVVATDPVRELDRTRQFVTPVDQGYEFTAPDGSNIQLGPRTSITLNYTRLRRDLALAEGRVEVAVRPDARRPFTVAVGAYQVQALGTRFVVESTHGDITLRVLEGKVGFSPRGEASVAPEAGSSESRERTTLEVGRGQTLNWRADTGQLVVADAREKISGQE